MWPKYPPATDCACAVVCEACPSSIYNQPTKGGFPVRGMGVRLTVIHTGTIYVHKKSSLKRNILTIKQNTNNYINIITHLTIYNTNSNQQQQQQK